MSTQKREPAKNYIGLMIDDDEEQRAVEPTVPSDRRMQDYFRGLVAAVLNRRGEARQLPLASPRRRPRTPAVRSYAAPEPAAKSHPDP